MEQHRFQVCILIFFALALTNKVVTASSNAENFSSSLKDLIPSNPTPSSPDKDFQEMLDYLNKTVPRDSTCSSDNSENCDSSTKSESAPTASQLTSDQTPVIINDSLSNTSRIHSDKDVQSGGSNIRAGPAIAFAIFVSYFFL